MYKFKKLEYNVSIVKHYWRNEMFDLKLAEFPAMIQTALVAVVGQKDTYHEMDVGQVATEFDNQGPWIFCKRHNLLTDDGTGNINAENFALEFMGFYNKNIFERY